MDTGIDIRGLDSIRPDQQDISDSHQ